MSGQDTYTLHKPIVCIFCCQKTIVNGYGDQMRADLVDVKGDASNNDDFKYILTAINIFSNKPWAILVKNKSAASVTNTLEKIFTEDFPNGCKPTKENSS